MANIVANKDIGIVKTGLIAKVRVDAFPFTRNGELVGKVTNSDWGVFFPNYDNKLRHPSQLYEAFLEGIILREFISVK